MARRKPDPHPGYVYFAQPEECDGPIKIGHTFNPERRWDGLQSGPFAMRYIAIIEGDRVLERRIQTRLLPYHHRREWFSPAPPVLALAEQIRAGDFDADDLPEPVTRIASMVRGAIPDSLRPADVWPEPYRDTAPAPA